MKARDIMSTDVIAIKKDTTVEEIAHLLSEKNISGVPVLDDSSKVIGMVSEKDLLYKDIEPHFPPVVEILGGLIFLKSVKQYNEELRKLVATRAEEIMTKKVVTIGPDTEVERIAELMIEKDINRIPVVDNQKLVGIISRADVIKYISQR